MSSSSVQDESHLLSEKDAGPQLLCPRIMLSEPSE
ncbi:hypothetical protein TNCT_287931, partial [Trichonephila clavata]